MSELQNSSERVAALRKRTGWTRDELAKHVGYSQNYIGMIERGEKEPGHRFWRDLEHAERLFSGRYTSERKPSHGARAEPAAGTEGGRMREDPASYDTKGAGGLKPQLIPIISLAQAGELTAWEDVYDYEDVEAFTVKDPKAIAVRIRGDSMAPDYPNGTIAILYPSRAVQSDNLVVARLRDGSVLFKRLHISGSEYHFLSTNPAYKPIVKTKDEIERLFPVGKTVREEL